MEIMEKSLETIERTLKKIAYVENDVGSEELDKAHVYARYLLRLSGTVTVGVADATAVISYAPLSLIKKVRLILNGEDRIKSLEGKLHWIQNKLDKQVAGEKTAPGLTIGAQVFSGAIVVDFELPGYENMKKVTRLNSALLQGLSMEILFGDAEDLLTPDATTTLVMSGVKVEITALEYPGIEAQRIYSIFKESIKKLNIVALDDDLRLPITTKNQILSITLLAVNNSLDSDTVVNKVQAVVDGTDFKRSYDWNTLKERTKEFYGIAPETGVACLIFDVDRDLSKALRLAGTGSFELIFDVDAPTGTAYIQALVREIIPYSG